ncbi:hypothetical protein CK203_101536 [Vitis vinifera]|uniref:Secreted protein n=1 Tax=Vitis vinifera TaxID=29760 RepID=A0A438F8Q6_VITVI|nr:hypothetical protein CK203_101536 [Vitis vinifera]
MSEETFAFASILFLFRHLNSMDAVAMECTSTSTGQPKAFLNMLYFFSMQRFAGFVSHSHFSHPVHA